MSRLVIVSNRVPELTSKATAGGLAVALQAALEDRGGLWFGWSGRVSQHGPKSPAICSLGSFDLATIDLTKSEYEGYYKGYANRTLWPLFHNRLLLCDFNARSHQIYRGVNRHFARQLRNLLKPDDFIWAHDYHFIPLADELRRLGVENPMGYFLHIPFPPLETMLALPDGRELVDTLLSYDFIGLQTHRDLKNFTDYVLEELNGTVSADGRVTAGHKSVQVGVFPIGIDTDAFSKTASSQTAKSAKSKLVACRGDQIWMVGVDRLDYTKGLAEKFRAFDALLNDATDCRGKIQLMQVAAPSREKLPAYEKTRSDLESIVGEVNGRFGTLDWTPIKYVRRAYSQAHLAALYRCSRVGLITPLRDGMNLVAKEYVAAQDPSDPGVLVLSKFAGAAEELREAIIVNPYDIDETAHAIRLAIEMPLAERQRRWQVMMDDLLANDVHDWWRSFLHAAQRSASSMAEAA